MRKIYIILIMVVVLIFGYILSLNYFSPKFNKQWRDCESDIDCILVPQSGYCTCGSISINNQFESEYNWFLTKIKIGRKIQPIFIGVTCEPCMIIENPIPRCGDIYIKNKCVVGSNS